MPETEQTGKLSVCFGVPLDPRYDSLCSTRWRLLGDTARACVASKLPTRNPKKRVGRTADDTLALLLDILCAEVCLWPVGSERTAV